MVKTASIILGLLAMSQMALASAKEEVYKLDTKASSIAWHASKKIGSTHEGMIQFADGAIKLKDKDAVADASFTVDMATLTNTDLKDNPEYQTKLVTHLKSEDFFNVEKFPKATFKASKVTKTSATEVKIKGELTILGKTQTIEFPATINKKTDTIEGQATVKLDRTKWGIKYGSDKFFKSLGDKVINDEFQLKLNIVAKK
ncbi:MAG: YceI family protein [Oligoflexia bacterium]|nr:YceI family protein [Oligoflexia bacterium]